MRPGQIQARAPVSRAQPGPLRLPPEIVHSPMWTHLRSIIEAQIDLKRKQNDGLLSPEQTAYLRGQIAALKNLLSLEQRQGTEGDPTPTEIHTEPTETPRERTDP